VLSICFLGDEINDSLFLLSISLVMEREREREREGTEEACGMDE